jgi:hypothetical protein
MKPVRQPDSQNNFACGTVLAQIRMPQAFFAVFSAV